MMCSTPYYSSDNSVSYPCGQCIMCLVNRRRTWTSRILLESYMHESNAFLTLTYNDENNPVGLQPEHHRAFMKALRKAFVPPCPINESDFDSYESFIKAREVWYFENGIRFYMCGEYGENTFRPHYHYCLFNFPTCLTPPLPNQKFRPCSCSVCSRISKAWRGRGHIFLGELTRHSAQYVAGYVTKKLTKKDDIRLIDTETGEIYHPEFSRMSNRPGIGATALPVLFEQSKNVTDFESLPTSIPHDKSTLPLGRYLRLKLSQLYNFKDDYENQKKDIYRARQMFSMLKDFTNLPEKSREVVKSSLILGYADNFYAFVNKQKTLNLQTKINLRKVKKC